MQVEIDLGITNLELAQDLRQSMQADMMAGAETQAAAGRVLLAAEAGPKGFQLEQNALRVGLECATVRRQDTAFTDAIEQAGVDTLFQLADALADRGLGNMQFFRGQLKRLEFGHGEKRVDLRDLHVYSCLELK